MFTGIITAVSPVLRQQPQDGGLLLTFARPEGWDDLDLGESVATDGACLTVAALREQEYDCFLMPETLRLTTFGIAVPDQVNLERSLRLSDRLNGHLVQGHADAVGTVTSIVQADDYRLTVEFPADFQNLVIRKGSIGLNGVSLTVADLEENRLTVALIPHTLDHTTLGKLTEGSPVNLEFDIVGKYIAAWRG